MTKHATADGLDAIGHEGLIGFVGLGQMGLPIARRMLGAGHRVLAFDRRDALRQVFEADGGQWADGPRDIASRCRTVFVSLPTPEAVEAVVFGDEGASNGLVHGIAGGDGSDFRGAAMRFYVDLSTTGPEAARSIAKRLAEVGVVALDAPVSGGVASAEQGGLAVMVSGPTAAYASLRPVFESFGAKLFHVGEEAGMGHMMKLLNNLLSTTALAATYEALSIGAKAGLDPKVMLDIIGVSSGTNHAVAYKIPKFLLAGVPMGFSLDLSYKDVRLAVEAGEALCGPMRFGPVTRGIWQEAMDAGGPKQDYLQVVRNFESWAGVQWAHGKDATAVDQGDDSAQPARLAQG